MRVAPATAITVQFDGTAYHVYTSPAPGHTRGSHIVTTNPAEIADIARAQHALHTVEPRLLLRADGREASVSDFTCHRPIPQRTEAELAEIARRAIASGARIRRMSADGFRSIVDRERDASRDTSRRSRAAAAGRRPTLTLEDLGL